MFNINILSRFKRKSKPTWDQAIQDLQDIDSIKIERFINAALAIDALAHKTKIPQLYELLKHKDFMIREAAAIPIARLMGASSLPELLNALVKDDDDGHDSDSLVSTITDLIEFDKKESMKVLKEIFKSEDKKLRVNAAWALGFTVPEVSRDFLMECYKQEKEDEVRQALEGALEGFAE